MTVWTTKPLERGAETPCSPHLFRDCKVLVWRDKHRRDPATHEHEAVRFIAHLSPHHSWYRVTFGVGRAKYSVCTHCVRRADRYEPEILALAEREAA